MQKKRFKIFQFFQVKEDNKALKIPMKMTLFKYSSYPLMHVRKAMQFYVVFILETLHHILHYLGNVK